MLKKIRSVWRAAVHRSAFEDGMDAEMRFHLDARTADLMARGMAPEAARRRARLEFGPIEKQKDLARASRGLRLFDEIHQDLRYALRTFARNKGFTVAAVTTLALGIGANAAIFNLIDALVLRQLPVSRPDELLQVVKISTDADPDESFSYPMVQALDARQDLFVGVAGFSAGRFTVGSGATLQRVRGGYVSGAFYETLGLRPAIGRLLTRADDVQGAPIVAVASYDYWQRQFAGDPSAVGQTLTIYGRVPSGQTNLAVGSYAEPTITVTVTY